MKLMGNVPLNTGKDFLVKSGYKKRANRTHRAPADCGFFVVTQR